MNFEQMEALSTKVVDEIQAKLGPTGIVLVLMHDTKIGHTSCRWGPGDRLSMLGLLKYTEASILAEVQRGNKSTA